MNAVSEVVMNRPRPLRAFDQIYMRAGDIVRQAIRVSEWARGSKLAFIGDGDGIALSVAMLVQKGLAGDGPTHITVFDFDERIINSVRRLAHKERLRRIDAELYNCLDPFPQKGGFDRFYTNPPWGESNNGGSVIVFARRGLEAIDHRGQGMIVIADDPRLEWPSSVLREVQGYAIGRGLYVASMEPRLHAYHLPEAEDLMSCNLVIGSIPGRPPQVEPEADTIEAKLLANFYGRSKEPRVRYVRDRARAASDRAAEQDYILDMWENML